jgi:uncharacterized membrane protein
MIKHKLFTFRFIVRLTLTVGLVLSLVLGDASTALAARSGGRIGGGSFRTPSRSLPSGGSYRTAPRGGYGYGGGGFGFPFLIPFFGFGGFGGLFTIFIVIALANFLVRAFQNAGVAGGDEYAPTTVSVAKVQVGLLATARDLQPELDRLTLTADTGSSEGRAMLVQEASLALLRHPEYWVYATTESQQAGLEAAEAKFNQYSLTERSKFTAETLAKVDNRLLHPPSSAVSGELVKSPEDAGDYIIVTIIVGVTGKLDLPPISSSEALRQALQTIGGIGSDRLLAVEVLWTPQAKGDSLSSDDILTYYPDLRLV